MKGERKRESERQSERERTRLEPGLHDTYERGVAVSGT